MPEQKMKPDELRTMSIGELKHLLVEHRSDLMSAELSYRGTSNKRSMVPAGKYGGIEPKGGNTTIMHNLRKNIARIITIIREKEDKR